MPMNPAADSDEAGHVFQIEAGHARFSRAVRRARQLHEQRTQSSPQIA